MGCNCALCKCEAGEPTPTVRDIVKNEQVWFRYTGKWTCACGAVFSWDCAPTQPDSVGHSVHEGYLMRLREEIQQHINSHDRRGERT